MFVSRQYKVAHFVSRTSTCFIPYIVVLWLRMLMLIGAFWFLVRNDVTLVVTKGSTIGASIWGIPTMRSKQCKISAMVRWINYMHGKDWLPPSDFKIAVNVCGRQFSGPGLHSGMLDAVKHYVGIITDELHIHKWLASHCSQLISIKMTNCRLKWIKYWSDR